MEHRTTAKHRGNRGGDVAGTPADWRNGADESFHRCTHCETGSNEFKEIIPGGFQFCVQRIASRTVSV
jgi:hypothetical protein